MELLDDGFERIDDEEGELSTEGLLSPVVGFALATYTKFQGVQLVMKLIHSAATGLGGLLLDALKRPENSGRLEVIESTGEMLASMKNTGTRIGRLRNKTVGTKQTIYFDLDRISVNGENPFDTPDFVESTLIPVLREVVDVAGNIENLSRTNVQSGKDVGDYLPHIPLLGTYSKGLVSNKYSLRKEVNSRPGMVLAVRSQEQIDSMVKTIEVTTESLTATLGLIYGTTAYLSSVRKTVGWRGDVDDSLITIANMIQDYNNALVDMLELSST